MSEAGTAGQDASKSSMMAVAWSEVSSLSKRDARRPFTPHQRHTMTTRKKMSWFEYFFGVASKKAKNTWSEMRAEYQAGLEGRPSAGSKSKAAPTHTARSSGPPWWEVLHVPRSSSLKEVYAAYRELMRKNHPDKVAHLSERIRKVAEEESLRINTAYAEAQRQLNGAKSSR